MLGNRNGREETELARLREEVKQQQKEAKKGGKEGEQEEEGKVEEKVEYPRREDGTPITF